MAAPPEVTITNLSGIYQMNKRLSDDPSNFFILQGLGWLTRNAIQLATVTLTLKQFQQEGATHIEIEQNASGLSVTKEYRILTWTERDHDDKLFGQLKGRSRFFKKGSFETLEGHTVSEEDKKFLLAEVLKDGSESAFIGDDDHIQTVAQSQTNGWTVDQVWGFEDVNGEKRYTRRLVCTKDGVTEKMRIVYDYQGPISA